jgi:signal transduction histidine kinase
MAAVSAGLGWLVAGPGAAPAADHHDHRQGHLRHQPASAPSADRPGRRAQGTGDTFDGLLARLEAAFAAQRQFAANASHELRTPLAWQRTLVQVALADPDADFESLRAARERVLASGAHQERILEALLTLSRGQAGLDKREPFDLVTLAGHVLRSRQPSAHDRQLTIHAALNTAPASGDPQLAERLIANLADNALTHNTPGGYIEVVTGTRDSRAVLSVTNTGPMIPATEVGRLLRPFQRLGTDCTGHGEGLGLGLSIVQAITQAHVATLTIRPQPSGGLHTEVSFPEPSTGSGTQAGAGHSRPAEPAGQPAQPRPAASPTPRI